MRKGTIKPDMTPDVYGRIPMICESGLSMTKASMMRFVMYCLQENVEILSLHPFNRNYKGCHVSAAVRIHPDQIDDFQIATGGTLSKPHTINLN